MIVDFADDRIEFTWAWDSRIDSRAFSLIPTSEQSRDFAVILLVDTVPSFGLQLHYSK